MEELERIVAACDQRRESLGQRLYELKRLQRNLENPAFVVDEEQSVQWNRKERVRKLEQVQQSMAEANSEFRNLYCPVEQYIIERIVAAGFTASAAKKIFAKAYDSQHSYGFHCVLQEALDLCEFVKKLKEENCDG